MGAVMGFMAIIGMITSINTGSMIANLASGSLILSFSLKLVYEFDQYDFPANIRQIATGIGAGVVAGVVKGPVSPPGPKNVNRRGFDDPQAVDMTIYSRFNGPLREQTLNSLAGAEFKLGTQQGEDTTSMAFWTNWPDHQMRLKTIDADPACLRGIFETTLPDEDEPARGTWLIAMPEEGESEELAERSISSFVNVLAFIHPDDLAANLTSTAEDRLVTDTTVDFFRSLPAAILHEASLDRFGHNQILASFNDVGRVLKPRNVQASDAFHKSLLREASNSADQTLGLKAIDFVFSQHFDGCYLGTEECVEDPWAGLRQ
ncbi:hypothetical protein LTS08_000659 [Lithohypha guttulata]|nr:hypothetical protein LTS08_000659 [Lithohypha guttulata]